MRVVDLNAGPKPYKSSARNCGVGGCIFSTREGKPYCPEHVLMNPHAHLVLGRIAHREKEDAAVREGIAPVELYNTKGITARAILQHLSDHGTRTRARLCRELNLERSVLDGYAEALLLKALICPGITNRGTVTLTLRKDPA